MWLLSSYQLLRVWWHPQRVGSSLLSSDVSIIAPTARRKHVPPKHVTSEGMPNRGRSAKSKSLRHYIPLSKERNQGKETVLRVSSELRKLCLEDFPADKEIGFRPKPVLKSKPKVYEFVFGITPCVMALTHSRRRAYKLFVKDGEAPQRASMLKVCEEANRQRVQISRVSKKDLDKMSSGGVHQGVCLQVSPLRYLHIPIEENRRETRTVLWLVLEKIQDPMNLGAILRSAYFLGVDRVISSLQNSCPLTPVVSKASSGVMEVMEVYGHENLEELLKVKVEQGWHVAGTVGAKPDGAHGSVIPCSEFQMAGPTLLLMGGEGEGLSNKLLSQCRTLLTIPAGRDLTPGIESLNVSVAAGILLHSLLQRK